MSRRPCDCSVPHDAGKNRPDYCRHCGGFVDPRFTSNDETLGEFLAQLEQIPGVPPWFLGMCRERELAGRPVFGHAFLDRDNCVEGIEETLDQALYAHLHLLRCRREGRQEHIELALEISKHAAEGAALFARMKALR